MSKSKNQQSKLAERIDKAIEESPKEELPVEEVKEELAPVVEEKVVEEVPKPVEKKVKVKKDVKAEILKKIGMFDIYKIEMAILSMEEIEEALAAGVLVRMNDIKFRIMK